MRQLSYYIIHLFIIVIPSKISLINLSFLIYLIVILFFHHFIKFIRFPIIHRVLIVLHHIIQHLYIPKVIYISLRFFIPFELKIIHKLITNLYLSKYSLILLFIFLFFLFFIPIYNFFHNISCNRILSTFTLLFKFK